MFRIRPIYDTTVPADSLCIEQVQAILTERFPLISPKEVAKLPSTLKNPLAKGYRTSSSWPKDSADLCRDSPCSATFRICASALLISFPSAYAMAEAMSGASNSMYNLRMVERSLMKQDADRNTISKSTGRLTRRTADVATLQRRTPALAQTFRLSM